MPGTTWPAHWPHCPRQPVPRGADLPCRPARAADWSRSVRVTVQARLFTSIHSLPGLAAFEDPRRLDRIQLAEEAGESAPAGVINSVMELTAAAITGAGFVLHLAYLVPLSA